MCCSKTVSRCLAALSRPHSKFRLVFRMRTAIFLLLTFHKSKLPQVIDKKTLHVSAMARTKLQSQVAARDEITFPPLGWATGPRVDGRTVVVFGVNLACSEKKTVPSDSSLRQADVARWLSVSHCTRFQTALSSLISSKNLGHSESSSLLDDRV